MVVHKEEAEFRIIQCGCIKAHGETILTALIRINIWRTRNTQQCARRWSIPKVGNITKAKHDLVTAFTDKIIGAPVGAGRVDDDLFPVVLVKGFKSQVFGRAD